MKSPVQVLQDEKRLFVRARQSLAILFGIGMQVSVQDFVVQISDAQLHKADRIGAGAGRNVVGQAAIAIPGAVDQVADLQRRPVGQFIPAAEESAGSFGHLQRFDEGAVCVQVGVVS